MDGWGVWCSTMANMAGCGGNRAWTVSSDGRLKTDIAALGDEAGLSAIMKLRPVSYRWRTDDTLTLDFGFIAQEVEPVLPVLVGNNPDVTIGEGEDAEEITDVKSMRYSILVVPLVKAVQELKTALDDVADNVIDLFARSDAHETRIAKLEADNDNLRADNEQLRNELVDIRARLGTLEVTP